MCDRHRPLKYMCARKNKLEPKNKYRTTKKYLVVGSEGLLVHGELTLLLAHFAHSFGGLFQRPRVKGSLVLGTQQIGVEVGQEYGQVVHVCGDDLSFCSVRGYNWLEVFGDRGVNVAKVGVVLGALGGQAIAFAALDVRDYLAPESVPSHGHYELMLVVVVSDDGGRGFAEHLEFSNF